MTSSGNIKILLTKAWSGWGKFSAVRVDIRLISNVYKKLAKTYEVNLDEFRYLVPWAGITKYRYA